MSSATFDLESLNATITEQYNQVKALREAADQFSMRMIFASREEFPALHAQFLVMMRELMEEDRCLMALQNMYETMVHEQEVAEWEAGRNQDHA